MTKDEHRELVGELKATREELITFRSRVLPTLKSHDKMLNGNGQPGLLSRVDKLEAVQVNCPAREARRPVNTIATAALVVAGITTFINLLPVLPIIYRLIVK